jgi:hypothetical protein
MDLIDRVPPMDIDVDTHENKTWKAWHGDSDSACAEKGKREILRRPSF